MYFAENIWHVLGGPHQNAMLYATGMASGKCRNYKGQFISVAPMWLKRIQQYLVSICSWSQCICTLCMIQWVFFRDTISFSNAFSGHTLKRLFTIYMAHDLHKKVQSTCAPLQLQMHWRSTKDSAVSKKKQWNFMIRAGSLLQKTCRDTHDRICKWKRNWFQWSFPNPNSYPGTTRCHSHFENITLA